MGNPHAIVYLDKNVDLKAFELEKIGPMFENHPAFPDRVNTEFIQVCDSENLNMRCGSAAPAKRLPAAQVRVQALWQPC